nr:helix-turn-helix transcriptional regulator [Actinomycetales bacterium]
MPGSGSRVKKSGAASNRGPAAAAENRAALLDAARRLFSEEGYRIPFSAIARAAGVAQAVMYRHFPSKLDVALAVFEENLTELESISADPEPLAFWRVWDRLVVMTIESASFVEIAIEARLQLPEYTGTARLEALIDAPLARARAAGLAPADLTTERVLLTERMVYGLVATSTAAADTRAAVDRGLALVPWTAARH